MRRREAITVLLVLMLGLGIGCQDAGERSGRSSRKRGPARGAALYRLAVHPLHNPAKLNKAYQPLIDYLNSKQGGARFALEASKDYASFEEKYRERKPEFLLPNPWQTLQAMKAGYRVIAMAGEPADFKGLFIGRRDGGLVQPADLAGKRVSYPAPTALAACIMPQYFLHKRGIDVNTGIENRYVGSQESSIMNVYLRLTAAGATWPPPWRAFQKEHPVEAAELTVLWETESLVNNSVMTREDVSQETVDRMRDLLLELNGSPEGETILAGMETARFLPAADVDYEPVREYVARFERDVRPVERR